MAGEYYALCATQAELDGLSATNLSIEPHPTEFFWESDDSHISGDGNVIGLGFANCVWTWGKTPLSASEWNELMTIVGTAASAVAYIRTRTNTITAGKYTYRKYQCIMHRPQGKSISYYRFVDASIKFSRLVDIS